MSEETEETTLDLLPDLELPKHKDRLPVAMSTSLTGASSRTGRAHTLDDVVVLVIEAKVADVGHKVTKKGLIYHERFDVQDAFELGSESARAVLQGARVAYRQADDARHGRVPLIEEKAPSKLVWADASGSVLDDDDLAAIRGARDDLIETDLQAQEQAALQAEAAEDHAAALDALARVADGDTAAYDDLSVERIVGVLEDVDEVATIFAVQEHELAGRNRKGALKRLAARADEITGGAD